MVGVLTLGGSIRRLSLKHSGSRSYGTGRSVMISASVKYPISSAFKETGRMYSLVQLVAEKESFALVHAENVSRISVIIGAALGLSAGALDKIRTAAFLHDIGKSMVPASLLNKPDRLTGEEMEIVKRHTLDGAEITSRVAEFQDIAPVIRHHHEKYDGTGYPGGLKGNTIPLFSRIISLADAFDAMVQCRSYSPVKSSRDALNEINRCSGTQFDPVLVNVMAAVSDFLN